MNVKEKRRPLRISKKIVFLAVFLVLAGAGGFLAYKVVNAEPPLPMVDTYAVTRGDLINSINVTGMVESGNAVNVYTTLSYPVERIEVEVGDVVQEGDVLCKMDASALENTIRQNEATLANSQTKANHNLELAQKDLETVRDNVDNDYNTQLLQADSSVQSAEAAVERAENSLRSAQQDATIARKNLRDARDERLWMTLDNYLSYDEMLESYRQKSMQADLLVESAEISLEAARKDLESAKSSRRAIEAQVQQGESSTEDAVTTARLNTDFSDQYIALEKLRADLADATVTAPASGTITAVYAIEGSSATGGLLFVIEDTDDLKVQTKIKEYDIGSVSTGMPVTIKADGTGDEEFEGELSMISPTTLKDTTGKTVDTTSAEFAAEVSVRSKSSLRIGMNARMNIITEKKADVLSVPVESIVYDEDGSAAVFILVPQEPEGQEEDPQDTNNVLKAVQEVQQSEPALQTYVAKKVSVTTGMETDFACEIVESELQEGDEVVTSPAGLEDGMEVAKLDMDMLYGAMMG